FNRQMPEEINRVVADHLSTLLFAPTVTAIRNLCAEGIRQGVHQVGDVMHESAVHGLAAAEKQSQILRRLRLEPGGYVLVTVHRAENADAESRLQNVLAALGRISHQVPVVWPVHPRTRKTLESLDGVTTSNGLRLIEPVSYF